MRIFCCCSFLCRQLRSYDRNPLREFSLKKDAADGKWTIWTESIALSDIQAVRRRLKVRFSAVLLTAISRAVTRYMQTAMAARDWKTRCTMSAYQAVSMWTPSDAPVLENKLTGLSTPMIVNLKLSALEQLKKTNSAQKSWLRPEFLWGAYTFTNLTCNTLPHIVTEKVAIPLLLRGITMFVSSAMGPPTNFSVDGHEVFGLTGIMPLPPSTSEFNQRRPVHLCPPDLGGTSMLWEHQLLIFD
jgi:hypothetical protein